MSRARWAVAGVGALVLAGSPFAVAAGTGDPLLGGTRNPGNNLSKELTRETQIIGDIDENEGGVAKNTGGYVTRQSNKSDTGGGAIYGCRAKAGTASCVAANNLSNGNAFRFQASTTAAQVGLLRFGTDIKTLVDKPPFATNGTGLVTNLNADKLDGMDAADIIAKAKAQTTPSTPGGSQGTTGPQGEPGQSLVATRITPENATYGGVNVVDVPGLSETSDGPSSTQGTELFKPVNLDEGTYLITGTVQAFDFTADAEGVEYGVLRTFLDGKQGGTIWTPDVPDDVANAAQATATSIVTVPAGGGTLTVRGAMRTSETDTPAGQMGANLIVTKIATP